MNKENNTKNYQDQEDHVVNTAEEISEQDIARSHSDLIEKVAELEDRLLRNVADMDNLRKRTIKEMEDIKKYSITSLVKDLIDTLENTYRAIDSLDKVSINNDQVAQSILSGIEMIRDSMLSVLTKHGVKRNFPLGEVFDHNLHQAIGHQESSEFESGTVSQVIQAGYTLDDRLLRPAMVMIAK